MVKVSGRTRKFLRKGNLETELKKRKIQKKTTLQKKDKLRKALKEEIEERAVSRPRELFQKKLADVRSQKEEMEKRKKRGQSSSGGDKGIDDNLDMSRFMDEGFEGEMEEEEEEGGRSYYDDDGDEGEEKEEGDEGDDDEEDDGESADDGELYGDDELDAEDDDADVIREKQRKTKVQTRELEEGDEGLHPDVQNYKKNLSSLKDMDPEFYEYLAQQDQVTDISGLNADILAQDQQEKKEKQEEAGRTTITIPMLQSWIKLALSKDSLEEIAKLVTAFQVAVMSDTDAKSNEMPFKIDNEEVFNELMVFCLENFVDVFYDILGDSAVRLRPSKDNGEAAKGKKILLSSLPSFKKLHTLINSFCESLIRLIDDTPDSDMLSYIVKNTVSFIPFIACFAKLSKQYLKSMLRVWAEKEEEPRIHAFLCIRNLSIYRPYPFVDLVLKGSYLFYMRNARFMNSNITMSSVTFMSNSVVELYGLDFQAAYQHAFIYLRQLAITLKESQSANSISVRNRVYSWQFVNALRVWTDLLCGYPTQDLLRHLIYPLVQIIQTTLGLDSRDTKQYPVKLHLIRLLNKLSVHLPDKFINSAPFVLEMLTSPYMQTPVVKSSPSAEMVDFHILRKFTETQLNTRQSQEGLCLQILEILCENLNVYAYNIAFPELVVPVIKILRTSIEKLDEVPLAKKYLPQLLQALEDNTQYIQRKRETVDFTPRDVKNLNTFYSDKFKKQDRAPLILFYERYQAEAAKWEKIIAERRAQLKEFEDDDDDEEGTVLKDNLSDDDDDDETSVNEHDDEKSKAKAIKKEDPVKKEDTKSKKKEVAANKKEATNKKDNAKQQKTKVVSVKKEEDDDEPKPKKQANGVQKQDKSKPNKNNQQNGGQKKSIKKENGASNNNNNKKGGSGDVVSKLVLSDDEDDSTPPPSKKQKKK